MKALFDVFQLPEIIQISEKPQTSLSTFTGRVRPGATIRVGEQIKSVSLTVKLSDDLAESEQEFRQLAFYGSGESTGLFSFAFSVPQTTTFKVWQRAQLLSWHMESTLVASIDFSCLGLPIIVDSFYLADWKDVIAVANLRFKLNG